MFIERTGTIAILGFVFAEYAGRLLPFSEPTMRVIAAGTIIVLTTINVLGIRWGTYIQNVFTVLKIAALMTLIAAGGWVTMNHRAVSVDWTWPPFEASTIQSLGVALVFVLWIFGGWTESTYVAEEVRDPTRNVPRSIIGGVMGVTVLYALVNWSYLVCIPIDALPKTPLVAARVMQHLFGSFGATMISWMVACSAFGALNGYILTGARILYAIGNDHVLFAKLSAIHPTFRTPALALWANAGIAIGLVFTKTLDQIMTYSTVVIGVFFTMVVVGVMRLRRTHPAHPRPYRAWGYPVTPMVFVLVMLGFIVDVCLKQPREAVFGFGLLLLGLPLYWLSRRMTVSS